MANAIDLLTLTEGMEAIAMTGSGANHEDQVAQAITGISARLDDICGPVVIRTITDELHYPNGSPLIFPNYQPVSSLTTVTEYQSGTGTVLTAEDFDTSGDYLLTSEGFISRQSGFAQTRWYGNAVKVTYTAGRYASTATVGAKWKVAASAILRRWWAREAPAWARGGDPFAAEGAGGVGFFRVVVPVVEEFLADERRAPAVA